MFRIQLSTKALSNIVPGGNAAGSALGYRLLTLSGISGPDAGFALATAGIGSAVVLNIIFWLGLVVSIPIRGVNPLYGLAAVVGVIIMGVAAMLVIGLTDGPGAGREGGALDRPQAEPRRGSSSPPSCARSVNGSRSWSATASCCGWSCSGRR